MVWAPDVRVAALKLQAANAVPKTAAAIPVSTAMSTGMTVKPTAIHALQLTSAAIKELNMMRFWLLTLLLLPVSLHAQERTAGGSLSNEASWAALKSKIERTDGNLAVVKTDVDAMKSCAASGKIWKPGTGCVEATIAAPPAPKCTTDLRRESIRVRDGGRGSAAANPTLTSQGYQCVPASSTSEPVSSDAYATTTIYICVKTTCK